MVRAVVGANWGDEGKGKITDMLGQESDIIVRFQGGANAGHTIVNDYGKFALHTLPSGIFYGHTTSIIGNGVALNIPVFFKELQSVVDQNVPMPKILVSDRAQMVMSYHIPVSYTHLNVLMCAKAHELIAQKTDHPLHVGITEAGTLYSGNIKSAVGLGVILYQGIGDTIRVSLTGDPAEEVKSARLILKTLGLRKGGVEVVSCPTCGRTKIDLIGLANKVEAMVANYPLDIRVAVMGLSLIHI